MSRSGPIEPPADLSRRRLPTRTLAAESELVRVHRVKTRRARRILHFSRNGHGRWDDPAGRYGVCYLGDAVTPWGALAETLLHEPGTSIVAETDLADRYLARVRINRDIILVTFHGSGLSRLDADASVTSGDRRHARHWAAALYAHASRPDGIIWRARPDDDAFSIAIFDRARDALELIDSTPLLDAALLHDVAAWLDRYGIAIT